MKKLCYLALLSMFLALPAFAQTGYSVTVLPAPAGITVSPASGNLPNTILCGPVVCPTQVTVPYSSTLTLSGGIPPYTASVATGALPAGVTMTLSGSVITFSGTPTGSSCPCSYTWTLAIGDSSPQPAVKPATVKAK